MAFLGYGSPTGELSAEDIDQTFTIDKDATSFSTSYEFVRMDGGAVVSGNQEWDKYRLIELDDPDSVGSAVLGNTNTILLNGQIGDGDAAQPDGASTTNRNDWQHDTFIFNFDTSSAAWKALAVGESMSVTYLVNGTEYRSDGTTESDSLEITMNFVKTCFTDGALIRMADGSHKRAGDIVVGDLVATADHGAQPVRWVGLNPVMQAEMKHFAKWRPVRISAGALGAGLPQTDLLVSQLHRILVRGEVARARFGAEEVLVPARFLTGLDGVDILSDPGATTYVHFMFDRHEVVWANGLRSESFLVSPLSRSQIGEAQLAELEGLFPTLGELARSGRGTPARPFVRGNAAVQLAAAHKTRSLALQ